MFRRFGKKRVAVGISAIAALAFAVAAYAYFTGTSNSATGSATVGSSTQWGITQATPTFATGYSAIYPGDSSGSGGTEYFPFTVTNNGKASQNLASITVAVSKDVTSGDAKDASGNVITGCKASWFTVVTDSGNPSLPDDLAASGSYQGKVDLTMQDAATSQDNCQGKSPAVVVTASS